MTDLTLPPAGGAVAAPTTAATPAARLAVTATLVAATADVVLMTLIGTVIPPLLVFAVLTAAVVLAARRWPRKGLIAIGLMALLANAGGAPFLAGDLASPSDPLAFVYAVLSGGGRLVAIVAVVLSLRGRDAAARPVGIASLAILGIAVAGSTIAWATTSSDVRRDGDVAVPAVDFAYPETVAVASGGTLFVENRDRFRHTFAVEAAGIDVLLEPGVDRRIPIDLPSGSYPFVCSVPGHETMAGTLEVR